MTRAKEETVFCPECGAWCMVTGFGGVENHRIEGTTSGPLCPGSLTPAKDLKVLSESGTARPFAQGATKRMLHVFKRKRGLSGNVTWTVDGHSYYWNGPGARLRLMFGDQLVSIDHPSASASYETSREAEAAVRRFTGLPSMRSKRKR